MKSSNNERSSGDSCVSQRGMTKTETIEILCINIVTAYSLVSMRCQTRQTDGNTRTICRSYSRQAVNSLCETTRMMLHYYLVNLYHIIVNSLGFIINNMNKIQILVKLKGSGSVSKGSVKEAGTVCFSACSLTRF